MKQNRKISKAKSIYIIQYTLDNEFVKEWDSATTASKELKINQGNITQCCKGERKLVAVLFGSIKKIILI